MKRHIKFALIYAILAMVFGVFYREFTKAYDFIGDTALSKIHTHLFLLGMVMFLLVALFDDKLHLCKPSSCFLCRIFCGKNAAIV